MRRHCYKNTTLSTDKQFIELACDKATREHSILNAQRCTWLEQDVSTERKLVDYDSLMEQLVYAQPGKKFYRDEMNER
ncbi:MAG: hypothetical protein F6K41_32915 [Symploca sp. SIO3E6]|nr:hypothetical protein [Caldora sp. SIO3E6]